MTIAKHKKHVSLTRPNGGKYGRNEFGLIGAPCGIIQQLSEDLGKMLSHHFRIGFMDARHQNDDDRPVYHTKYVDNINHHSIVFQDNHIDFGLSTHFNKTDLVLINSNHFVADKQIVLIHPKKKESLQRKLDRLTNVLLFVLTEEESEVYPFLADNLTNFKNIPVVSVKEINKIAEVVKREMEKCLPPLKGLVLAGGKSMRMGNDKGAIQYYGKAQREYMADLLSKQVHQTYISVRDRDTDIVSNYELLPDTFQGLGPYGGILSAFRKDPNAAWLTVATDVPLLDKGGIRQLIESRDPSKLATCYHNPDTRFPEPLITIWEPRAYASMLQFLARGYSCPRKVLINSDVNEIQVGNKELLTNVNTQEEFESVLTKING